ncbi:MAG TPA: penicillin-binding protein 2 [Nitrospiraceae bacterium]|nr:penicillin-binding protein 2 [Nitrospiraceae bacterium]
MEKRIKIGVYIILIVFAIFILRLWQLQVINGREYRELAEQNRLRIVKIPAVRGIIYDRNGVPFVRNVPSFDISVIREYLPKDRETLSALSKLIGLSADEIQDRLRKAAVHPYEPVKLKIAVPWQEVARVEARKADFPGLQVDVEASREYINGILASHIIGHLGRLTPEQSKNPDYKEVPRRALVGQLGIEMVYDKILRGTAGRKFIEVDAMGRKIKVVGVEEPVKGNDITLTLDITLQKTAEEALKGKAGAVVALDPNTGEILALASSPAFDPNLFSRGIKPREWMKLLNNPQKPLLNRALQSQHPPGSTFKIITAIAGLEEGVITKNTEVNCTGVFTIGRRVFRCWKPSGRGTVSLHRAMVESCNIYFYEVGKRLGINKIAEYAKRFGLGKPVGLELLNEKSGIVPSIEWKLKTRKEQWFQGDTINVTIGQGYLSATPMQMALLMSIVANGGKIYKPHLIKDSGVELVGNSKVNAENLAIVRKSLQGVVEEAEGTGGQARSSLLRIGGKTGTTQVVGIRKPAHALPKKIRNHAWFVAFAPVENPQIALSVFVEHGGYGGVSAAPIAKKVIEAFYENDK